MKCDSWYLIPCLFKSSIIKIGVTANRDTILGVISGIGQNKFIPADRLNIFAKFVLLTLRYSFEPVYIVVKNPVYSYIYNFAFYSLLFYLVKQQPYPS